MISNRFYRMVYFVGMGAFFGGCLVGLGYAVKTTGRPPSINLEKPHWQYIRTVAMRGDYDQAVEQIETKIRLAPNYQPVDGLSASAYGGIALGLLERGHHEEAERHFVRFFGALRRANQLPSDDTELLTVLARVLDQSGRIRSIALRELPGWLNNLAWIRATHQDQRFRDADEAVRFALQANEQTRGVEPTVLDTLAAAYAEAGDWQQAKRTVKRAIHRAEEVRADPAAIGGMKERLALYKEGRPYRDPSTPPGSAAGK